jgi:hypothetical protein
MSAKRLTKADEAYIVSLWKSGKTQVAIQELTQISRPTIIKVIRRNEKRPIDLDEVIQESLDSINAVIEIAEEADELDLGLIARINKEKAAIAIRLKEIQERHKEVERSTFIDFRSLPPMPFDGISKDTCKEQRAILSAIDRAKM